MQENVLLTSFATYREVDAGHTIHDDEDVCIGQLGEAVVQADREHEDQHLQIEVER